MKNLFIHSLLIFCIVTINELGGEEKFEAILGTVNSEPITTYDLSQRIKIFIKTLGMEDTVSNRDAVRQRTLDLLIEEKVKSIQTKKEKISIPKKDVESFISRVFSFPKDNFKEFKKFLSDDGIDFDILYEQISTELLWKKLVNKNFSGLIFPNPDKVKEVLNEYKKKKGSKQYNFSEIIVLKKNREWEEIESSIKKIYNILKLSPNFGNVAAKFSESSSSLNGGNLGWVSEKQIDTKTINQLEALNKGEFSKIFKVEKGYKIVKLVNSGKVGEKDGKSYSLLNFSTLNKDIDIKKEIEKIDNKCLENKSISISSEIKVEKIKNVNSEDLSKEILKKLESKKKGEITEKIVQGQKVFFLFICDIKGGEFEVLTSKMVEDNLFQERLNLMGETFLNKLKKQANIKLSFK